VRPQFDYGEEVRVVRNVRNDGTFPGAPTGQLLIRRGSTGYVRDVGSFLQDQIIYAVYFIDEERVVGCREEELQPASAPWVLSRFEFGDKVQARLPLGSGSRVLVRQGTVGEIMRVIRSVEDGVSYHVQFPDCNTLLVPESALDAPGDDKTASTAG
jgi:nitrogen fixation protein NifZ